MQLHRVLEVKTVGEEKAAEIAMDWMRAFYGIRVGAMENIEQGQSHLGGRGLQLRRRQILLRPIL
jgi:hypothetical protein